MAALGGAEILRLAEAGTLAVPLAFAVAKDGSVYVADAAGKRVQKFVRKAAKP